MSFLGYFLFYPIDTEFWTVPTAPAFPDENDLGDHDAFLYLQNKNWILATSDKRWVAISNEVCPDNLLDLLPYKI